MIVEIRGQLGGRPEVAFQFDKDWWDEIEAASKRDDLGLATWLGFVFHDALMDAIRGER